MEQFPGLLETLDLKGVKPGRMNPVTGLLNEVVNPPALNQPDPNIIMGPERVKNFQNWFKESKVVDDYGRPLTLYHGTTHDFNEFDPGVSDNEGYFGSAIYMTTSPDDASENYGASGPDLKSRIEKRAEEMNYESYENAEVDYEEANLEKAKEELMGPAERVIPVHAAIQNPVYLTKSDTNNYINFKDIFNIEGPPSESDYETEDEYYAALDEHYETSGDEMFQEINDALRTAFYQSDEEAGYKWSDFSEHVVGPLLDAVMENDGEVNPQDINNIIRENSYMADHMNPGETIKNFFKELGYDGIIMNAYDYFPNMRHTDDAQHYIIFDPTKVKGMFNRGTYDPNNPDYLSSVRSGSGLLSV